MRIRLGLMRLTLLTVSTVSALGLAELLLRHSHVYSTYNERSGLGAQNFDTEKQAAPWLWTYRPNTYRIEKRAEFNQDIRANSEGLVGDLPPLDKRPSEFRIIVVGDSFIQGVGVRDDQNLIAQLAQRFAARKSKRKFTFMNAGVAGSDPVFEVELLRRRLLKYKPDLVLLNINGSDIWDLARRGGQDRFDENGFLKHRRLPAWTGLFSRCFVVRAIAIEVFGYNLELQSREEARVGRIRSIESLVQSGVDAQNLGKSNHFRVIVLFQPTTRHIEAGQLPYVLAEAKKGLDRSLVENIDLTPGFKARISKLTPEFYWPLDLHFTSKGYAVFADALDDQLWPKLAH